MIELTSINKHFGKLHVLKNVNYSAGKGECVALIGPNGCGKTTLIKTILGMVVPDSGTIRFNGEVVNHSFEYRKHIGYMPQIGRYPDNMTIGQIMGMITQIRNPQEQPDEELLNAFKLQELYNKKMRTLSGGTTQKVSATLAFLFNPHVLILDEPTAGLDPLASETLKEKILREKEKGKLILITSHLLSELDDLVTHVTFMQEGQIRFHKGMYDLKKETGEDRLSRVITSILRKSA
jgi:Cu-processing system ATP-binding protein